MKKRILSALLVLCMVLTMIPGTARATNTVASGECGENITWELDSNGTLTITGTGEMTNYRSPNLIDGKELSPWCNNLDVKNVIIQSGVTNIGEYSFYHCENLLMINIPNSIVSIGSGAFAGCTALADVNIPDHVTTIGNNAFLNCGSLSDVVIPPSVTTIGMNGFSDCSGIENLTIPVTLDVYNGVSQNDSRRNIFTGCSAISHVKITGIGDMPDYTMSRFSIAWTSKEFPVSAPWYIGSEYGNSVTVDISNGITNISARAFRDCKNMTSITIPTSVQTIGYSAFTGCTGLTDVYFGGSKEQWEAISVGSGNDRLSASDITIHYNSLGNITNESAFVGTWEIDDEKTMAVNGESMTSIFGHDYGQYGSEMEINADHTFTYGIAVGIGGEGDWRFDGSQIIYDIITYEEGQNESGTIQISGLGEDEYYLVMPYFAYQIYWKKVNSNPNPSNEITFRSDDNFTVNVDDSTVILANIPNASGLQQSDITWSSSDESIAIIESSAALIGDSLASATAVVRGVSPGTATITVNTSDGRTASCEVVAKVAPVLGDFRARANSASTCLTKGSTTEMYIGYYDENQLDLDTKGYIYTLSDSNVLDILPGAWSDKDGQRCQIIAKEPGSCILTITHPQNGESNILRLHVVDGNTGYTFNSVPTMTIEPGKTTNFYNHKGLIVDEFAYVPNKDANGNIEDYTVTMTVYNTCNLYGAVSSFDSEGNLWAFRTIEKLEPMSTSFVENIKDLINRTGDLFSLINNSQYYSGESISKKTEIEITVPVGGYIEIANDASSAAAILVNSAGIILEGAIATVDFGTDANKLYDDQAKIVSDAVNNCLTKDYTYFANKAIISTVKSQAEKELKNANWNFDNYGDLFQSFIGCIEDFGIDIVDALVKKMASIEGVLSISVNKLKACIPTGKLIDFLYDGIKFANWGTFCANFNKNIKDANGIYIYAPTLEDVYTSNGVKVTPSEEYDDNTVVHAYLVTDNNEFDSTDAVFPTTETTSIGKTETYNITMYKNGQITQPRGVVTVRIPLSEEFQLIDKARIKVYRHNDDGTVTDMYAEIIDGYAVFTTDHFSYYSLVEEVKKGNQDFQVYTVTFDANKGMVTPSTMTTNEDGKLAELPTPVRDGYSFDGWFTALAGGDRITANTVFTSDATVYARWTYNSNISDGNNRYPSTNKTTPTTYRIIVPAVSGGTVNVNPTSAKKGDTVTIIVTPDSGRELDYITVTDKNGDNVSLTDCGNGKYVLTMPDSSVTLDCAFKLIKTDSTDQPTVSFIDVVPGVYYYDAVAWAVGQGITNGTTATTFSPDAPCTRGQIVTFLWRVAGSPSASGNNPFTDVQQGDYWYDAVLWAVSKGITTGTSAATFSPNDTCTRGQTVTFLYRNAGSPTVTTSATFADVVPDAYYSDAVAWALAKSITNGTTASTFSPQDQCTRGQIVTFLYRSLVE